MPRNRENSEVKMIPDYFCNDPFLNEQETREYKDIQAIEKYLSERALVFSEGLANVQYKLQLKRTNKWLRSQ